MTDIVTEASPSVTEVGFTIMRTSRPACKANDFSTPVKELLICSNASKRRT